MSVSRKLLRNYVLMFGGNVLGQIAFFSGLVHLARVLGPAGFGAWNFAQTWLLYLFRGGEPGIETLAIREISMTPERTAEWMKRSYLLRIPIAVMLYALTVGLVLLNLFPKSSAGLIAVFSLGVVVWSFTLEWVLEAKQDVIWVSVARVMKGVLFAVPVFVLVRVPESLTLSAWAYVGSLALSVSVIVFIVVRRFGWSDKKFTAHELGGALRAAIPLGAATTLSQYGLFFGTIAVGYILNDVELGYFTAAHRIVVFLWAYVIASSNRIVLPTLSRYFNTSKEDFDIFMRRFFRLSVLLAVPLGLAGTVVAPILFPVLYGHVYDSSIQVFQVLIWGLVAATIRSIFEVGMIASGDQRLYLRAMIIQALVYTAASLGLTVEFGIRGTAGAYVASELITLLYVVNVYSHARTASHIRDLWKPLTSLVASVFVAILVPSDVVTRGVISVMTYLGVFVIIKGVTAEDMRLLKSVSGSG